MIPIDNNFINRFREQINKKEFSEEGLTMQMHFSEATEEDIKQDLIEAREGKIPRLSLRDIGEL